MAKRRANSEERDGGTQLSSPLSVENETNLDWATGHSRGTKRFIEANGEAITVVGNGQSQLIEVRGDPKDRALDAREFYCQSHFFVDELKQEFAREEYGWDQILPNQQSTEDLSLEEKKPLEGKWRDFEHQKFLEALRLYGKDWPKITDHVGTRSVKNVRSHGQKFLGQLVKFLATNEGVREMSVEDARYFHGVLSKRQHWATIEKRKREEEQAKAPEPKQLPSPPQPGKDKEAGSGKWSIAEHNRFLEALKLHGKDWPKVTEHVKSRPIKNVISHGQKFFTKVARIVDQEKGTYEMPLDKAKEFHEILSKKVHWATIKRLEREKKVPEPVQVFAVDRVRQYTFVPPADVDEPKESCYSKWKEKHKLDEAVFNQSLGCSVKIKEASKTLSFRTTLKVLDRLDAESDDSGESQSANYKVKYLLYDEYGGLLKHHRKIEKWMMRVYQLMSEQEDLEEGQSLEDIKVCLKLEGFREFDLLGSTTAADVLSMPSVFSNQQQGILLRLPNLTKAYMEFSQARLDDPDAWDYPEENQFFTYFNEMKSQIDKVLSANLRISYEPKVLATTTSSSTRNLSSII